MSKCHIKKAKSSANAIMQSKATDCSKIRVPQVLQYSIGLVETERVKSQPRNVAYAVIKDKKSARMHFPQLLLLAHC